jgi:DNA-binding PadR family transcriptional regulator
LVALPRDGPPSGLDVYDLKPNRWVYRGPVEAPFKQGALYPVLRNMSGAGLLSSRVVPSYSGPPRRYYRITPLGREVLAAWRETWLGTRAFVDSIVQRSTSAAQEMPS